MKIAVKNILANNLLLKIYALIFGIFFWLILSSLFNTSINLNIPLSFYGSENLKIVDAPETIAIKITGKRSDLYNLDLESLALHVNLDEFDAGEHLIEVTSEKLFLPNTIKLLQWSPSNPVITLAKNEVA